MTGVLETAALAAIGGAVLHLRNERHAEEEAAAQLLFRRYFHADIMEVGPERATSIAGRLPPGLDAHAAASIRIIERYQEERKKWFMGFASSADPVGDVRTRVLEELKQWLMTLSEGTAAASDVSVRLDYCWQFLLRPGAFETHNRRSFLQTLAEVCRQLEALLRRAASAQREGAAQLGKLLSLGREAVQGCLLVLALALPDESTLPLGPGRRPTDPLQPDQLLAQVCAEEDGAPLGPGERVVDFRTEAGAALRALLRTAHFRRLGASDEEAARENPAASASAPSDTAGFVQAVEGVRAAWQLPEASAASGLLAAFRGARHQAARGAFLDLCGHLDRFAFFLAALRPYRRLAGLAGDVALCWLRGCLGHLLQELQKLLMQMRQARLELMRAAKRHLQDIARRGLASASAAEVRWAQRLRHIDEAQLDALHRALLAESTELLAASTLAREVELKSEARQGLQDVVAAFQSADFQARCSLALPDGFADDLRHLGLTDGGGPPALALPLG